MELWGFQVKVGGFPQKFSVCLAAKLCIGSRKFFEVQEYAWGPLSSCQVWWSSDFAHCRGGQKRSEFCLFVSLCVRCAFEHRLCTISPWSGWNIETILILLDRGRFVVVHPRSTFSICHHLATPQNTEVQKNCKIWGFSPREWGRIRWSRWYLAHTKFGHSW